MNTMKKLNLFLGLGAIALSLFFTSCEEEVNPAPVISYDQASPVALAAGETSAVLTGTIVAEANLSEVKLFQVTDLSEQQLATITSFTSGEITTTDDVNYNFRFEITGITEDVTIKITATDKDDQVSSKSIEITSSGAALSSFTAVLMGAQSNLTTGSYLDAETGEVYLQSGAESNSGLIDMVYYFGSTNEATLTAPDDVTVNGGAGNLSLCAGFSTKNATRFGASSLSSTEFDAATSADVADISVSNSKMIQLAQGDVIEFETDGGKKGLIKVASISTGTSGSITIDVKIEQ